MSHDHRKLETAQLVVRFQRGDHSAFEELTRIWERPLYYFLRRMAPTEADTWELLQDTWIRLLKSLKNVRDPYLVSAYFYATARSALLSKFHKRRLEDGGGDGALVVDEHGEDDRRSFENVEDVHQALDQIPILQREVVTLFFLEDLSLEEIAAVIAIPVGTVKSRLYYGKRALRNILLLENKNGQREHQ